ncbi:MAG: HD domain-containing phosphohydrolase [Alphaproteobacteria bacterium]
MSETPTDAPPDRAPSEPAGRRWLGRALTGTIVAAVVLVGIFLILRFVDAQRQHDLRAWQNRLGIVADGRFAAVEEWRADQTAVLTDLAENASLQIYLTELRLARGDPSRVTAAAAQREYLANLMTATAARAGFDGRLTGPEVRANVRRVGTAGLALLDAEGGVVAATPAMPPLQGRLAAAVATAGDGPRLIDIHAGADGRPAIGFVAPVFAIQAEARPARRVGTVIGVKPLTEEFLARLRQPGSTASTAETFLVRRADATIEYLSPLLDGSAPLVRRLAADTADLAAAFAMASPGGFAIKRDYRDREVLVTGRAFTTAPWVLVHKIDRAEALAESDARRRRLLVYLLLALGVAGGGALALWRHGASRRASAAARRYEGLANRFARQRRLLTLVTDSQPDPIFILDFEGRYRFANAAAAHEAGIAAEDMLGKSLASVLGPGAARRHDEPWRQALAGTAARAGPTGIDESPTGPRRVVATRYIPLADASDPAPRVLVVERDISAEITERERRERTLTHTVRALVTIVDRRDPFAADHSARVARIARAIAEEMALDETLADTAERAGSLMNIGKILVSTDLLTKDGRLTEDEIRRVRDGLQASADLLDGIEFDGPVVETLRQLQENVDGSGHPNGLAGTDILVTARIVAVANAFVALVSPRAWRPGIDIDQALDDLLSRTGQTFDRAVVAALISHLDNHGGRAEMKLPQPA